MAWENAAKSDKRIVGYCDRLSAAPGEDVGVKVSAWGGSDYQASLVRVVCGDARGDGSRFDVRPLPSSFAGRYPAREQFSRPGSFAEVELSRLPESFSSTCVVWPTRPGGREQAILGTWSPRSRCGFGLGLSAEGHPFVRVGDGNRIDELVGPVALRNRRWYRLGFSYDAAQGGLTLHTWTLAFSPGEDRRESPASTRQATAALSSLRARHFRVAGWTDRELSGLEPCHFDGKIGAVRLVAKAVSAEKMEALSEAATPASFEEVLGFWDFSADPGSERAVDLGPESRDLQLHQMPTRAVVGHRWTGDIHNHRDDPRQYDAIHFHSDDLIDAQWATDFSWRVPDDHPSGVYAIRLDQGDSTDFIPVFVRPPPGTAHSRIAFLAPTASYLAYANQQLMLRSHPLFPKAGSATLSANSRLLQERYEQYGPSLYEHHADRSGVTYSSRHRPILNLKPAGELWQFNADTNILAWLEATGESYDVITDEDLDTEGVGLLEAYQVVLTGSHPEYISTRMYDAIDDYLRRGGRLMYLGGNGFYWRIAFSPTREGVIEVRRAEDGTRPSIAEPGEYYHAFSGEYGGLWRRLGRPPQKLLGVGFAAQGFDGSSPYHRTRESFDPRARFVFEGVDSEVIGDYGSQGGGAAGEEIDRADPRLGTPDHALILASSRDHAPGMLRTKEEFFSTMPSLQGPKVRSDMVFFECPGGGAVFSVGSIAFVGALAHNDYRNDISRIASNVLRRFDDPTPFALGTGSR